MTEALGPQFLFHGTAMEVDGDKLLPASVHGKGSYWNDAGSNRGEPANEHAWAHPDENTAWGFAHDRVIHTANTEGHDPRAKVYAVHPNAQQSPGQDHSIPGEVKASHFDIAERIDIMPGRQGTFPQVNWNRFANSRVFTDNEDANHPSNLSVQFGHEHGRWGDHWNGSLRQEANKADMDHYIDRLDSRNARTYVSREATEDTPLPGMDRRFG